MAGGAHTPCGACTHLYVDGTCVQLVPVGADSSACSGCPSVVHACLSYCAHGGMVVGKQAEGLPGPEHGVIGVIGDRGQVRQYLGDRRSYERHFVCRFLLVCVPVPCPPLSTCVVHSPIVSFGHARVRSAFAQCSIPDPQSSRTAPNVSTRTAKSLSLVSPFLTLMALTSKSGSQGLSVKAGCSCRPGLPVLSLAPEQRIGPQHLNARGRCG